MYRSQKIYSVALKYLTFLVLLFAAIQSDAQNLNNPNKRGPMGTQVNTFSGNLYIPRTDIYIPARRFDLNISFYYNSFLFTEDLGFGKGWFFEYNIRYTHDTLPGGKIILWGDGREDKYDSIAGGNYKTPRGFFNTFSQYQPNKFVLTELDGRKFYFDNAVHKGITKMEEPNGNFINFGYADSLLTSVTNAAGQTISFTYNATGRLTSVTDAISTPERIFTYSYDAIGNLKEVKDPLNGKWQFDYLVNGPMKSMTDKNSNKIDIIYYPDFTVSELIGCNKRISFSYDTITKTTVTTDHLATGNQVTKYTYQRLENLAWLTSMSGNCCGFNKSFEFDDQGNKIKETDANGNIYTYTYDDRGNMLTITNPLDQVSTYVYSGPYNNLTSYTDANGNVYNLQYDAKGNLTQITAPGNQVYAATYNTNGDIITSTDPKSNVYTYNYDAFGNPTTVTGPNSYTATLSFNARGHLLSYTDARTNTHHAEYDILGRLKKIIDPNNNDAQFNYDAAGNITSIKNKAGENIFLSYDASNRIVNVKNPLNHEISLSYDGMDNVLSVKNALGNVTSFSYDNLNRLKNEKDPLNNLAGYSYDGNGNLTSSVLPNGQTINYTYDKNNRVRSISDVTGTIATFSHDKNGNLIRYTNGTGATKTATYDNRNRLKTLTDALGNISSYTYDANGNIATVTDRNGKQSSYTYDERNRIKTSTDNNGNVITISYDAEGNVTELKDQNNNATLYTYDNLNRLVTTTYPDGKFVQYDYDKKNNIISALLTDGTTINYQYDSLNRMVTKTLPGGVVYNYGYDVLGRVISAENNNGTVTLTYDALSRVTSETFDGRTVRYQYNISGRTQTTIYPDSTVVVKEFDTRNRLIAVAKNGITLASYQYNGANQPTVKTFNNGVISNLQYDVANRLSSLSTAGGNIQNSTFSYDKEMNKTAISRTNSPELSEQFTYDDGYRLLTYKRGSASPDSYNYDAVGNRTTANINGINTTYTTNNLNQLTSVNGAGLTYDNRGNLTFDGTFYKTYDAENRLLKDSSSPAGVITYGYDAFDRRIIKSINGNAFKYTYAGLAQIEERDATTNALLNRTVFNSFLSPIVNEKGGVGFYYHQNEQNSVEAITNSEGSLLERYQYDVYGKQTRYNASNTIINSSLAGNRFGFTGQQWDSATGSNHFFFRNYSPVLGTFNQRDLIGYEDGMGLYQYVGDNPANGIDVFGLKCKEKEKGFIEDAGSKTVSVSGGILTVDGWISGLSNTFTESLNTASGTNFQALNQQIINENYVLDAYESARNTVSGPGARGVKNTMASQTNGLLKGMNTASDAKAASSASKAVKTLDGLGKGAGGVDLAYKTYKLGEELLDGEASNEQYMNESNAAAEVGISAFGFTPAGAVVGIVDLALEKGTGKGVVAHGNDIGSFYGSLYSHWAYGSPLIVDGWDRGNPCPPQGGFNKLRRKFNNAWYLLRRKISVVGAVDPNEIRGPEGITDKKWVSVKDRLSYQILFENDTTASAPAKTVRITSPIEPKQDASTFQLGSFGFNNQTFEVPANTAAYYQRLDCRDSLGLYVDITAGYDQVNNVAFWEFQSIDPVTQLPSEDALSGFLLLQDNSQINYGKGFVNFSIKPLASSQTLDTIGAKASIVFDSNEPIATNVWVNTIDAVAPTSSITDLPAIGPDTEINLHFTGSDDVNGSGLKSYSIYVSDNNGPVELYVDNFAKTDTTFRGVAGHKYKFYVSATDSVGNVEALKLVDSVRITDGENIICPGGNISFESNISGTTYQWQVHNGTGFTNVIDGGIYSGANTAALTLTGAPSSMYGYQYRCLVNGTTFSDVFLLKFGMIWEGTVSTEWENPANWSCGSLPDMNTDVYIQAEKPRYPIINSNAVVRSLQTSAGTNVMVKGGNNLTIVK